MTATIDGLCDAHGDDRRGLDPLRTALERL